MIRIRLIYYTYGHISVSLILLAPYTLALTEYEGRGTALSTRIDRLTYYMEL